MTGLFFEALRDSLKMIPFLFIVYLLIELLEYRYGHIMRKKIQKAGKYGPALGALAGSFPQCGFSVLSTALYTERLLTLGSLLAVYLATSDEAIPVILAHPDKAALIIPIIGTKIVIALIAGFLIDRLIFRKQYKETLGHASAYEAGHDRGHDHHAIGEGAACCGHYPDSGAQHFKRSELFFHPLKHTLKIFVYVLAISFALNIFFDQVGTDRIHSFLSSVPVLQPLLAGMIGLIPNCASSVALTQLYLTGGLSFGGAIAGLSASGGLGLLVLYREEKSKRRVFYIIGLLLIISVLSGWLIQLLGISF